MNISAPFIAQPIATILLAIAVLLCGGFGYLRLPVSALPEVDFPLTYRSRMVDGTPFFRMREVPGEPNSETVITPVETRGDHVLYRLEPLTGRKHQLRLHMASLGIPIVNDAFYPDALPCKADDVSAPLKLLSRSVSFIDPRSGETRHFASQLVL